MEYYQCLCLMMNFETSLTLIMKLIIGFSNLYYTIPNYILSSNNDFIFVFKMLIIDKL